MTKILFLHDIYKMMSSIKKRIYQRINIALLLFIISASYGLLLRWQRLSSLSFNYTDVLHAHSHVTFLGWGFLATISLITYIFIPDKINKPIFKYSFWMMFGNIVGMLISFPLQGYKLFSIVFLSIFLLSSYVYLWYLFKALKNVNSIATKFIRTGILYYYLSSVAIWVIPVISIKLGKIDLYHNAIYFYLHFLYNGFFVFTLFGLLIYSIKRANVPITNRTLNVFFMLTNIACIPTYALSLLWNEMPFYVVLIGFLGAILQVISLFYFWKVTRAFRTSNILQNKLFQLIIIIIAIAYFVKVLMQFAGAFPTVTMYAVHFKPYFVIGYIHLFTLGFMSLFLFLLFKLYLNLKLSNLGLFIFILGIVVTEILLFSQGILAYFNQKTINNYDVIMLMASFLMPLGLVIILINLVVRKTKESQII